MILSATVLPDFKQVALDTVP